MMQRTIEPSLRSRGRRAAARAALPALLVAAACGFDDGRTPLVIYSPHGREMLQAYEREFEARYPDVDVQWLDMGSQEALDRIRSERANPQADVWWGGPAAMFESAAAEGLLRAYEPTWAGALPPEARDPDARWFGVYVTPMVIMYNTAAVPADAVPRDWDDVLDPRWEGRVLIRDPLASGSMRTIFGMVIDRSVRATGDTTAGFDWLRRLDAQTKEYVLNPTLLYQKMARGEGEISLWAMPDVDELKARTSYPLDYVFARSGTPMPVDAIAVVAGTRRPELAQAFVEFVGGMEGVLLAVREHHRMPARTDLPRDSLPESTRRALDEIVPEPVNWERLQRDAPTWMRWWDERVRGRG
jgi:iron(III) transport system substrate-binding protein